MTDRFTTTEALNVGDTVYADFSQYGRVDVREGRVESKSPTGVVRVDFRTTARHSFSHQGGERWPASKWHAARLISADQYAELRAINDRQQREREAAALLNTASRIPANAANKSDLIAALRATLAAVEAL